MKQLKISTAYKVLATFVLLLSQFGLYAQDSTGGSSTSITKESTTTTTTEWYTQPWVWVVGAALLVIILVALFRGNNSTKEVSRTTVIKDDRL